MEKQLSLQQLKMIRDSINEAFDFSSFYDDKLSKAYIVRYGYDIETNKIISVTSRLGLINSPSDANWSYHLVMGKVNKG